MKQKNYIADKLSISDFSPWLDGKKVVIKAPTGCGKTTFILRSFLKYCKTRKKKILILSNRRLLRMQYEFSLAAEYDCYDEMEEDVDNLTYQELAEYAKKGGNIRKKLDPFDAIILDEAHFFYADADFNTWGTFAFLQILVQATFFKSVILLTATFDEVAPLIKNAYKDYGKAMIKKEYFTGMEKYLWGDNVYDFSDMANFDRFTCCFVPDIESLATQLAKSDKKSVVFIDDKALADQFLKLLLKSGTITSQDVFTLNAQVLEQESEKDVLQMLVGAGRLLPKILLTTSVLDNGTSIHDPDVGNVVIATESKLSFLQMLGRVRGESVQQCYCYIFPRDKKYYLTRIAQYKEKLMWYEQLENNLKQHDATLSILLEGWHGNSEKSDFLRCAITPLKRDWNIFENDTSWVFINYGDTILQMNHFLRAKLGNMLLAYTEFYQLSLKGNTKVAEKQMQWLGKDPKELLLYASTYKQAQEELLIEELQKIQQFNLDEFSAAKVSIAKKFQKTLFPDLNFKGDSFENKKLEEVCDRYGLCLKTVVGKDKRQRYSVEKIILEE